MARPSKLAPIHPELQSFGAAVRSVRLDKNVSQEMLAHLSGLDRSYMGGIERGEHNVALVNMKKIALALDVSVHHLMAIAEI